MNRLSAEERMDEIIGRFRSILKPLENLLPVSEVEEMATECALELAKENLYIISHGYGNDWYYRGVYWEKIEHKLQKKVLKYESGRVD